MDCEVDIHQLGPGLLDLQLSMPQKMFKKIAEQAGIAVPASSCVASSLESIAAHPLGTTMHMKRIVCRNTKQIAT